MADAGAPEHDELVYEASGLPKTGNWWSAFVIGLAGTILVTGIAPVMVTELGAASIPLIVVITLSGYVLCLFLAELSAMMPDRSGGSPSSDSPGYKDRWPRLAEHVNGFTAWAYWLGWFPVAPLNMILASAYIVDRFGLSTSGFTPIHTPIAYWTVGISVVGILLLFIPALLGLRFGTVFATTLALLSMIPLTFLAISWIFNPSVADFGQLWPFRHLDGSGFFASQFHHGWLTISVAFSFLLTCNVIAIMLMLALVLSALNAITGTARSLHQMSTDGQFPRFFQHVNSHGVPDRSMIFNVVCSIIVVFFGGAVEIYTFSNVGYLASFI